MFTNTQNPINDKWKLSYLDQYTNRKEAYTGPGCPSFTIRVLFGKITDIYGDREILHSTCVSCFPSPALFSFLSATTGNISENRP